MTQNTLHGTTAVYERWAQHYDAFFGLTPERNDGFENELASGLAAWLNSFSARTVLDSACGTGNPSLGLIKEGYELICADASSAMIDRLVDKCILLKIDRPRVICSTWSDLPSRLAPASVDAVICVGNALFHIMNTEEMVSTLKIFFALLRPGGRIYFDYLNVKNNYTLSCEPVTCLGASTINGKIHLKIRTFQQYQPSTKTMSLRYYLLTEEDGVLRVCGEPYAFVGRPFLTSEMIACARDAGFAHVSAIERWGFHSEFNALVATKMGYRSAEGFRPPRH